VRTVGTVRAVCGLVLLAACSSAPQPATPVPEPDPIPADAPAPPSTPALSPQRVAGSYRLTATIDRAPGRSSGRRRTAAPATPMRLYVSQVAAPEAGVPSPAFNATVAIRGYTRAPRGRSGQAAAWWPIPGDSIVIQFASAAQRDAQVQLRGVVEGRAIQGEVWFLTASGATFQLGTFNARRQGR